MKHQEYKHFPWHMVFIITKAQAGPRKQTQTSNKNIYMFIFNTQEKIKQDRGLEETGLNWKTWKVEWISAAGNFDRTATGLMMFSI